MKEERNRVCVREPSCPKGQSDLVYYLAWIWAANNPEYKKIFFSFLEGITFPFNAVYQPTLGKS